MFWKSRRLISDYKILTYKWLQKRGKIITFDDYYLTKDTIFSKKDSIYQVALFKVFSLEIFLYKGFIPIVMRSDGDDILLEYLKFTFPFDKFITEITNELHAENIDISRRALNNRFQIIQKRGSSQKMIARIKDNGGSSNSAAPSNSGSGGVVPSTKSYVLYPWELYRLGMKDRLLGAKMDEFDWIRPQENKSKYQFTEVGHKILDQCEQWLNSQKWYSERQIDWRRGFLLHGAPGNGKSSMVLEVNRKLGLPIHVYDLSSYDNQEFDESIANLPSDSASILFEDIDNIFEKRTNLTSNANFNGITFDFFINKISGVKSIQNKLIFITTNHLDKLDPALIRDRRVDETFEIPPLNFEEKRRLAMAVLDEAPDLIEAILTEGVNDTTATFENRCIRAALNRFWNLTKK